MGHITHNEIVLLLIIYFDNFFRRYLSTRCISKIGQKKPVPKKLSNCRNIASDNMIFLCVGKEPKKWGAEFGLEGGTGHKATN